MLLPTGEFQGKSDVRGGSSGEPEGLEQGAFGKKGGDHPY